MFNKNFISKKIKLVEGADLEISFNKEKGIWNATVAGNVLSSGRAFTCNICGNGVVDNEVKNTMKVCPKCIENLKSQIEPKKEETAAKSTPDGAWLDPSKKMRVDKVTRPSVGQAIRFFRKYKVEIVVPTIQEYLDVMAGMQSIARNYNKKRVLSLLDMCAKGMTRKEISKATGLADHTIYCTLLDFRKVNLLTTKDNEHYHIVPPYHYITKEK